MADQFTRVVCAKCGKAGHDSWNKALHDGIDHGGDYPNPFVLGDNCQSCWWPVVLMYRNPGDPVLAIYGPNADGFEYEPSAMEKIELPNSGAVSLAFSDKRDGDWSRGCVAARGQLQ